MFAVRHTYVPDAVVRQNGTFTNQRAYGVRIPQGAQPTSSIISLLGRSSTACVRPFPRVSCPKAEIKGRHQ